MTPREETSLLQLEELVESDARRIDWLTKSSNRDLQLAAMRAWPRYQYALQVYLERCALVGKVAKVPVVNRPVVVYGGKHRLNPRQPGRSR